MKSGRKSVVKNQFSSIWIVEKGKKKGFLTNVEAISFGLRKTPLLIQIFCQ
jgi:hypothetical protein